MRDSLRASVLGYLEKMKIDDVRYRISAVSSESVFASIFALYIRFLFDGTECLDEIHKHELAEYINSFQDPVTGLYMDSVKRGINKGSLQFTCFALSALTLLGASPRFSVVFTSDLAFEAKLAKYLDENGVAEGRSQSGNMAMFAAILLTNEYERTRKSEYREAIDFWFRYHDAKRNKITGYWGANHRTRFYHGFQNALHQYLIYEYWDKDIESGQSIAKNILSLQDRDGHFAPLPGGGGCWDYDASHLLHLVVRYSGERSETLRNGILKVVAATADRQNSDGGFCESKKRPQNLLQALMMPCMRIGRGEKRLALYKYRIALGAICRSKNIIHPHWSNVGVPTEESDLWNTWLSCLIIAEYEHNECKDSTSWNFMDTIGFGYADRKGR